MREHAQSHDTGLYTPADFYMLRAPALPAETFFDLAGHDEASEDEQPLGQEKIPYETALASCRQALDTLLAHGLLKQAVAIASTSLLEGLERAHHREHSRRAQRAYSRLLRYAIRMCTRPTPFGLFAGMAVGRFGDQSDVALASPVIQQTRTHPDLHWLFLLLEEIEHNRELVARLHVRANPLIKQRGGRLLLPTTDIYGIGKTQACSLRATPPALYALQQARQPVACSELIQSLQQAFPTARQEQVVRLIWQLWEQRFLLSTLLPPLSHRAPAHFVLEHLQDLTARDSPSVQGLQEILEECEAIDRAEPGQASERIRALIRRQSELLPQDRQPRAFLQVDTTLALSASTLTRQVGMAAAEAAETLLRLGSLTHGLPHLQRYLSAFIEHYGTDQEVPLLELLSPEQGLDAPEGYQYPPRVHPLFPAPPEEPSAAERRDRILCHLAASAINARRLEVELTDELLQQLEQWTPNREAAPASLDLYLQLHARSREALDRGEWRAVIGANVGAMAGGRSFGRFFHSLEAHQIEALKTLIQQEEACAPESIFAELSYLPPDAHIANVTAQPGLRHYEIPVGTTPSLPPERTLALEDLVVGVRRNRFYVRSLRLGKEVVACQSHMLNPQYAPNTCRFLLEVAQSRSVSLGPFHWGLASSLPFLPRVVRGKIIYSPARWNLSAAMLRSPEAPSDTAAWLSRVQQWRTAWRVPRYVYLAYLDNRLLLDLEHPALLRELQTELARLSDDAFLTLEELLPDFDHLWLEDSQHAHYFSEIVVPLLRSERQPASATVLPRQEGAVRTHPITQGERSIFPGGQWVYLKLYAGLPLHDELISGALRDLITDLQSRELLDIWFYIRYSDTFPHLRLRLRNHAARADQALLEAALRWGEKLAREGHIRHFSLDTYEREIERYGGPAMIDLMEEVFCVDSRTTSELIAAQQQRRLDLESDAIAVASLDHFFADWGLSASDRLRWLQQHTPASKGEQDFHQQQRFFCDLLAPWEGTHDRRLLEQRALLDEILTTRRPALQAIVARVRTQAESAPPWTPLDQILGSLAHMHLNRLLGLNRQREERVYALWRATLTRLQHRPDFHLSHTRQ
jgi:thiopeptide-type bacteriocin biosynthesis protein